HSPGLDHARGAAAGDGGRFRVHQPPATSKGAARGCGGGDGGWRRAPGGFRDPRRHPQRHRAGHARRRRARVALRAAAGAGMGVQHGHRATDRHRGRQPDGRGRRRDHGADSQDPPGQRHVPRRGLLRRGAPRGAGGVRGRAAPRRGGPVVSRRTLAAVIIGAWIVSLGWLVKREVFPPTGARLAEAALRVPPGAVYYRLAVAERQVGFASSTIDTSGTSIRVTDVLVLQVPAAGTLHHTTTMSRATFSRTLRFERLEAKFDGDVGRFAVRGLASGDTVFALSLESATDSETTRMSLVRPLVLPTILPLRLAFGGELKPGKVYTSAVFDPMLLAQRPVDVTVAAESTLVVPDSAGFDSTTMAWVAVHFDTVRAFRIEERSGGSPTT